MAALGAGGRADAEHALAARLTAALPLPAPVAAHLPHGAEIGLESALARLDRLGVPLALPVVLDRAGTMRFARWRPGDALTPGLLGQGEPAGAAPDVEPGTILAPLVGFDRAGGRLGQGGGYYDRAFARFPHALRIGVGWGVQEVPALPLDAWDLPLHAIATEAEWIVVR